MHTDSPYDPTLLEAARRGNSDAIARLIQQSLAPEGLSVQAQVTKTQFSLILDGEVQTHSAWLEALIQSSIQQLALPTIDTVQVQWPTGVKGDSTDAGPLEPSVLSLHPPIQVQGLAPDAMAAIAQPFIDQPASQASSKLIIGPYQSQWTEHGIAVTAAPPPESRTGAATLSSPWRKRRHVADRYRCPPITRLLNRQNEMKAAIATLQAGGTIEFHGEAGAGKSALLRALGHHPQITPRFPGGIVYQQTYDQPVEDILQGLFEATYEVAPVTPSALATASLKSSSSDRLNRSNTTQNGLKHKPTGLEMQQMLSQHRICLVLDEMALSSRQLQLLSQWSNLSLLVSNSRSPGQKTRQQETKGSHRFDLPQHRQMSVKGLPLKDAIVLFEEGLGRSLQPGEEQDTETLCACLGGHPRRLVQMAALVRHRQSTLSELVEQLNQGTAPEAIILRSVSSLPESERRIVAILAAFNGKPLHGIHLPPLADLDTVAAQLTTLVNQGLVWTDGQFYRLADNLLPPLQEHWNLSPWADQALTYFKRWLAHLTPPQNHLTPNIAPQGQYLESTVLPICENSETLFFLLHHGIQEQKWTEVLELSALMEPGLWWGQRWGRWYQTLVIQWQAAQVLQDQRVEARILHQIGSYALCSGYELMAQTCLIQSLDQRLELGDLEGAAISQYNLRVANISVDQIQQTASLRDRLEQTATAQTPDAPMETPSTLSAALVTDRESVGAVGTSAPLSTGPSPSRQSETTDVMNGTSTDPRPLVDQEGGATTDPVEPSLHSTQESTAPDMPDVEQGRIEFENAAVLDGRWPAWIWLVLGAGTLGIVGLIALLLGQSPETNISKLRSKHTFPPQRLGIISEPHQFVIENSSNAPWDINVRFDEGDRQEFAINHDDCTEQALAPDASCIITATFQPQQSGPRAASFLVQLGKNADAKPLALQGIGATVQAEFRPSEVEFGQQLVVERSDAKTITFKNNGTVAFLVNSITLSEGEDSAAFFIQRDTCSQQVLQPRDNCSLALSFTPTEARNYRTIVEVMDDTGEEIWRIPLIGEGIQPPPPPAPRVISTPSRIRQPAVQRPSPRPSRPPVASNPPAAEPGPGSSAFVVGPSSINFDDQDLNRERLSTLRVQNTGSNPLKIQAIQISPPSAFEIADNSCDDASILPGNECVVGVAFRPTEAQTYRSIITITADGAPAQTVEVSGTGRVDVTATTPDELATEPPVPLAINAFDATPATNLAPTDSTQLCYDISNAVQARLVNQTTGTTTDLNSASSDCVTLTPGVTTTYTLVAQNGDQTTERSVATTVVEPDLDPPSTPVAIAPTGSTFAYCNQSVTLQWNGSVDTNGPVRYSVTLQRQAIATDDAADGTSAWTSVFTQTTDQLQLSTSAPQSPDSYRWNVQAIDSAGNASSSSGWNEFLCINP